MTKDELNEIKKSSVKKDPATYEASTAYNPAQPQHQFSQNSKKQQQYNNYQRQQQQEFNMPFGKYQQNYHQNGKPQTSNKTRSLQTKIHLFVTYTFQVPTLSTMFSTMETQSSLTTTNLPHKSQLHHITALKNLTKASPHT